MNASAAWQLLKDTYNEWTEDKASRLAAALAYYTAFSVAPLVILTIAIVGFFFGEEAVRGQLFGQLQGTLGSDGAKAVEDMVANANQPGSGIIATIIGLVTLLFGASGVFTQLQDALNTIWGVAPKPDQGIWAIVRQRFFSFSMILVIGFMLLVALVITSAISAINGSVSGVIDSTWLGYLWSVINFAISFGVVTLLFAMIYKILPDATIDWGDVWVGAGVTALLFTVGKTLLGIYLGNAAVASSYGAAGSLIVFLLWVYYSAQILFFGAEFTQVYAKKYGSQIEPTKNAVALTEEMRARQGIPKTAQLANIAAEQGKGGATSTAAAAKTAAGESTPGPAATRVNGGIATAIVGFFVGLALLRRNKKKLGEQER